MATSEDLERSLRGKIEEHVNALAGERLEEVRRAHGALSDALARLGELRLGDEGRGALASAIAEHLRDARGRGAEEAARSSAAAQATGDVALLKAAVDDIDAQRTQADILHALVNRAASFAPRVAFFVVKNERATGWRARGLEGTIGDDRVRDISLALTADNVLSEVYRTRATWSGAPGSRSGDHELVSKLGDEPPQRMVAVPLVARDKCVAVLYADSAGLESDAINLEALETLVRVTGMAVELLAVKRGAPAGAPATTAAAEPQPATEATAEAPAGAQPQTSAGTSAPTYAETPPRAETAATDEAASQTEATEADAHEASPWGEDSSSQAAAPQASAGEVPPEVSAPVAESASPFASHGGAPSFGEAAPPPPASQASQQGAGTFAAPLGESPRRRYGQDAELPVEVSEEERRYHTDARRFARLLVSEIKLYNEQKVSDGRQHADLYSRLREEIDRSRQMYDKRVHPSVAPRYDYFHQELVNTLAEGDAAKLGAGYPGATVAA
ncbi:MAG: hypothetical protein LC746_11445 [Acidobacteria bacterium]|nr:hypothetical protein [Acidobacteriota bacterium]